MDDRIDVHEGPANMDPEGVIKSTWGEVYDKFDDMNLRGELLHDIYGNGFEQPSTIQQRAIIPCVKDRDVITQTQAGTDKNANFWIATLQQIDTSIRDCQALILAPTRELATQIHRVIMAPGENMKIHSQACIGGTNIRKDASTLKAGCHVVVGTPGRVIDMINRKVLRTNNIKLFVLDKADEMLSRDFKEQINKVFKMLPTDVQVILLSAAMPPELLHDIYGNGFEQPSTIQQRAIIPCVKDRDVITQTQAGTDKNANFWIATLQQIDTSIRDCQALILAPTRELATQIHRVIMALGENMKIHSHACVGGTNIRKDASTLKAGCHVVVGTPGRVIDMINRKVLRTNNIKLFVLDKADEMLSRDFKEQIHKVFKMLPTDVQVILRSAAMPPDVLEATKFKKSWGNDKSKNSDESPKYWLLEKQRQVRINEFRECKLIDVRDFYEKNIELLPGEKGISLSVEQWKKLLKLACEVNCAIEKN